MSQNSLRRTPTSSSANNSATAENPEKDFLDNLNLSLLINELLINYGSDQISKEEEERLESYKAFVNYTDSDDQGDIYYAYQHHLDWKKIDPEGNFNNPIGIEYFREVILHTFQIFKSAFEVFFDDDDEEIKSVLSNFDEEKPFYQSLFSTDDKKILVQMMQGLTPYLTKLLSLAIDGTEQKKQTVKKFLLIFPSLPISSDFACVAGNKQRIELASSMLFSRNIFDVALRNTLNEEIQKIFKDVDDIKQVHLFSCLLDSLTHSPELIASRDCYSKSPQDNIEIREIFSFIFESQLKLKQNLTKTLSELGDLYYENVYKKIFDENGKVNESLDLGRTFTEIIDPFMENLTPESSGIFEFSNKYLFNDKDQESEFSSSSELKTEVQNESDQESELSIFNELKTKEQFIEQLKKHLLQTHKALFTQDYPNFSEHPIDPQKIFSGDEKNGYYLNPFSVVSLSKLFDPITENNSPEEKITKKNLIYTGLMSLRLLTQNFANSNGRFLLHYFIESFNDYHATSFQDFFYNSNQSLKEEYEEFKDLIESILNGFTEITIEYEDNKDILSLYSKLILNPSGDDFQTVINEYRQLSLNNVNDIKLPNLLEFLIMVNHHDLVSKLIELSDDDFLLSLIDNSSALKLAIKKKSSVMLDLLLNIDMNSNKKVIINSYFDKQNILLKAFEKGNDKLFLIIEKIEEYLRANPEDGTSIKNLSNIKYLPHGNTVLILAVASRNLEAAKKLLDIGADINSENSFGITPLIYAISSGDIKMVRTLVDSQQSLELEDDYGNSPLSIALEKNPVIRETLVVSLSKLFDPITENNSPEEKITKKNKIYTGLMSLIPLTQNFTHSNGLYFLNYFIESFNNSHATSFQDFFYNSNQSLKEEYEEFKDLIESILDGFNEITTTYEHNKDILSLYSKLILNPSGDDFQTVINEYRQLSLNNVNDIKPPNLLEFLIMVNHHDLVSKLIELSDDDFLLSLIDNSSALKLAIEKESSVMLDLLLNIDMNSNKKVIINSYFDKQSILLKAFEKGNDKLFLIIEKIEEYLRANPQDGTSIKNLSNIKYPHDEKTVLSLAVESRNLEAAKKLLDIGADINSVNSYGITPLIYAISSGDIEMARTLVDSRQSLEVVDAFGNSPLSIALARNPVMAEILLDGGAEINIDKIKANNSILDLLRINQIELIKKLIDHGLDINNSFQPNQKDEFIAEILKIDPRHMEFFLERGLDLKTQNTQDERPYLLCKYLLDMDEDGQNNREAMLQNLKMIFLKHPDEVINAELLEKIQKEGFNENLKYVLELAKFAIENNPTNEDSEIINIAQKIKNKIDNLLDWESQILIIGNFISHPTQNSLDAQNEMQARNGPNRYRFSQGGELKEKFDDLFLTMKFIVEENKESEHKYNDNFLDNFIKLLEYQKHKESNNLFTPDENSFFKFIDKLIPLEKEWIINQINSLKNDNVTPIMKLAESLTPEDLKCFNYYIFYLGFTNKIFSNSLKEDLIMPEYIKALNLIDEKQLNFLLKDFRDLNMKGKEEYLITLGQDIMKELKIKNNLLRFNADFPQHKIRRSLSTNSLQATRLLNPSKSLRPPSSP